MHVVGKSVEKILFYLPENRNLCILPEMLINARFLETNHNCIGCPLFSSPNLQRVYSREYGTSFKNYGVSEKFGC